MHMLMLTCYINAVLQVVVLQHHAFFLLAILSMQLSEIRLLQQPGTASN
jgi:hypothetical protein